MNTITEITTLDKVNAFIKESNTGMSEIDAETSFIEKTKKTILEKTTTPINLLFYVDWLYAANYPNRIDKLYVTNWIQENCVGYHYSQITIWIVSYSSDAENVDISNQSVFYNLRQAGYKIELIAKN
jgi:hypothetical protein